MKKTFILPCAFALFFSALLSAQSNPDLDNAVIRFKPARKIVYGDPEVVAPLKVADTPIDWRRKGERGARWGKAYWVPSGKKAPDGRDIMVIDKSAPIDGAMGDIDGDGRMEVVTAKSNRFWCVKDASQTGRRRFPESSGSYLKFVYGGDLMLPDVFPGNEHRHTHSVRIALGDWDGDGLTDLIVVSTFLGINPWDGGPGGITRYMPAEYTGEGRGWIGDHWVFGPTRQTVWWYKNVGKKGEPLFADASLVSAGSPSRPLLFTGYLHAVATPIDWNNDGRMDLLVSADNRVILYLNTSGKGEPVLDNGRELTFAGNPRISLMKNATPYRDGDGMMRIRFSSWSILMEARQISADKPCEFTAAEPVLFKNPPIFLDSFPVPNAADWDGDGKLDLLVGYQDGAVHFFRNISKDGGTDRWAPPVDLEADGKPLLRHLQNPRSKQGPSERLWGYTAPIAIDFDGDGDLDIISGNSSENFFYFENIGTRAEPSLTARGVLMMTNGKPVETAWRTRPAIADFNDDGALDIVGQAPSGHLVIWWGRKNSRAFSEPETLYDAKGFPFLVATTSHSGGRSVFSVERFDSNNKAPDLLMSPFFSARTEFIPFFKNMGFHNGRLLFELRWRQVAREGHVSKSRFSHYRMLELAHFGAGKKLGAIAGVDDGDMYYWETPAVEPFDDKPLQYYIDNATAEFDPSAPCATVTVPSPFGTVEDLREGAPVFNNRPYKFGPLPEIMKNRKYVLSPEEARYLVGDSDGMLYVLVPRADGPRREIMVSNMRERGFEVVKHPAVRVYGEGAEGEAVIMQMKIKKNARIILSSWAVFFY